LWDPVTGSASGSGQLNDDNPLEAGAKPSLPQAGDRVQAHEKHAWMLRASLGWR